MSAPAPAFSSTSVAAVAVHQAILANAAASPVFGLGQFWQAVVDALKAINFKALIDSPEERQAIEAAVVAALNATVLAKLPASVRGGIDVGATLTLDAILTALAA